MNVIARRLQELREESEKGQKQLDHLEHQRRETRDTLLRISGAIQVLEEMQTERNRESEEPVIELNGVPVGSAAR